jgi:hypothetical protein
VRVPEQAGNGKAKVTVSFPDWKEGKVAPAELEVALAPGAKSSTVQTRTSAKPIEKRK